MKPDEMEFLCLVAAISQPRTPRDVVNERHEQGVMNYKRAHYLLRKWSVKGWYSYGVSLDLGWITEAGKARAADPFG